MFIHRTSNQFQKNSLKLQCLGYKNSIQLTNYNVTNLIKANQNQERMK